MKTLYESLLDDEDKILDDTFRSIKNSIEDFLYKNYGNADLCKISSKPNKDGKYIVNSEYAVSVRNSNCTSLTNGYFIFGTVNNFDCSYCKNLTSLEGAPEKVLDKFVCRVCPKLTSLEGAPKEVSGHFLCYGCGQLKNLEGGPKKVLGNFDCSICPKLNSLEGAPEEVSGHFFCSKCRQLKNLEGAPKTVGRDFYCQDCGKKFTIEDVENVSIVKGKIHV